MTARPASPAPISRLRTRRLRRGDAAECRVMLPPWLGLQPAQLDRLLALWEQLADHPATISGVIEDLALPAGQRLQGWGVTLVMPEPWLDELAPGGRLEPDRGASVTRDTYLALLDGRLRLPDEREIGRANAGDGVVFMSLHFRMRSHRFDDPYALLVINMANDHYRFMHGGYRVRAAYQQALHADAPMLVGAGFVPRHPPLPGAPERQTVLYGLTREEADTVLPGSTARHVFDYQSPRFRFSSTQRRLLWLTLGDESDDTLMALLEVSPHGLKKLWRGIYDRVEDVWPEFFGDDTGGEPDGKRGPEKRRQVLAYVRQRPEELRPWAPQ